MPKVKVSSFEFISVTTLQLKVNPKTFFFRWVPVLANHECHSVHVPFEVLGHNYAHLMTLETELFVSKGISRLLRRLKL